MLDYLQTYNETGHKVAPLVSRYPTAANFLCSLIDQGDAILVKNVDIIFVKNSTPKITEFLAEWEK